MPAAAASCSDCGSREAARAGLPARRKPETASFAAGGETAGQAAGATRAGGGVARAEYRSAGPVGRSGGSDVRLAGSEARSGVERAGGRAEAAVAESLGPGAAEEVGGIDVAVAAGSECSAGVRPEEIAAVAAELVAVAADTGSRFVVGEQDPAVAAEGCWGVGLEHFPE